jgi:hypothetical protein
MAEALTVEVERYRFAERVANAGATVLHALGLRLTSLDVDDMLAEARRRTGLTDWGDDTFIGPFREITRILTEANITPLARIMSRSVLIKAVANRLRIREYVRKHPEVKDIKVERPIFVVGFPRTGTTVMQNLLALHHDRRALQFWELTAPIPEYDDREEDARRRIKATNRMLDIAYWAAPEMAEMHAIRATTAEECWSLFANTFAVLNYEFQSGKAAFGDYLLSHDMTWAYAEYREMLQILLHQRPAKQLVLKCPEHLWFIDSLLKVFPDACVVWTHRDPYDTIASYCSLNSINRRVYYGEFHPAELGPFLSERFLVGIERAMEVRKTAPPERFYDLRFEDVVKDPPGAVEKLERYFGLEIDPGHREQMEAWLHGDREDERGKHRYAGPRYGLDRDDIRARYAAYIRAFDVVVK